MGSFPLEAEPLFVDAVSDLENAANVQHVVEQVERLVRAATSTDASAIQRLIASRQLQATLECFMLQSRGSHEH